MPVSADAAKAELTKRVVAHAREQLGDQAASVEPFFWQYFDRVDPGDLLGRSVVDVYGAAMAHWQLARHRRPGETKVSVYTPDFDQHGWQSFPITKPDGGFIEPARYRRCHGCALYGRRRPYRPCAGAGDAAASGASVEDRLRGTQLSGTCGGTWE